MMTSQGSKPPVGDGPNYWRAEAARLAAENAELRTTNARQQRRIADLEGQVAALSAKVAKLAKLAFGDSSEKKKAPAKAGSGVNGQLETLVDGQVVSQSADSRSPGGRSADLP
ncbi:MAG: hypothetical protein ACRD0J_14985 [Acidimicrobiales bacterium]